MYRLRTPCVLKHVVCNSHAHLTTFLRLGGAHQTQTQRHVNTHTPIDRRTGAQHPAGLASNHAGKKRKDNHWVTSAVGGTCVSSIRPDVAVVVPNMWNVDRRFENLGSNYISNDTCSESQTLVGGTRIPPKPDLGGWGVGVALVGCGWLGLLQTRLGYAQHRKLSVILPWAAPGGFPPLRNNRHGPIRPERRVSTERCGQGELKESDTNIDVFLRSYTGLRIANGPAAGPQPTSADIDRQTGP